MRNRNILGIYGIVLSLYGPALLTNFLANQYLSFWDFYESWFVVIALIDFIPFSIVAHSLIAPLPFKVLFNISGIWMLILAMPDVYLSYVPWLGQNFVNKDLQAAFLEYHGWWFGSASIFMLLVNIALLMRCLRKSLV